MLLHDARRAARTSHDGELVLLEEQDRSLWDRAQIAEGARARRAGAARRGGSARTRCRRRSRRCTRRRRTRRPRTGAQIVGLYDVLLRVEPSPVVELNRAVAVAMRDGPAAGLALIDAILARGELTDYHLAHAARADLCARLGRRDAIAAYERALDLTRQEPERRFLERKREELRGS